MIGSADDAVDRAGRNAWRRVVYAALFYAATIAPGRRRSGSGSGNTRRRRRRCASRPRPRPTTQSGAALRVAREVVAVPEPVQVEQVDLAVRLGLPCRARGRAVAPSALFPPAGPSARRAGAAVRRARSAFAMVGGLLAALLARRIVVERVRYISGPSDYLMLALILAIGVSGLTLKFVARTDIVDDQGVLPRPDAVSTGGRCRRSRAARPSRAGRWR